jgi:glycosyltransferase involved in cell wall biosynthesis
VALVAKRWVERSVYRKTDAFIVLSGAFKRILVERFGLAPWTIDVVPPGVDVELFKPSDRAATRRQLGLSESAWIAIAVRRLTPRMGLEVLLSSWALPEIGDDGLLLIVGDGPFRQDLERFAARSGLANRVRFLGQVSDDQLVAYYQAADVCVVPSTDLEGFGLVVLESLACGTPVIASDVGGLPEALAGLDPTLLVPPGNVTSLAGRLEAARSLAIPLPSQPECRAYAEQFSWSAVAERTKKIYRQAGRPRNRQRLRVVYFDHCARLSGGELSLAQLLPALDNVDAHVILGEDGPLVSLLLRQGTSVEVLTMKESARGLARTKVRPGQLPMGALVQSVRYVLRLSLRLCRLKPDLVHTNSLKGALLGGLAARLAGVPVVCHMRDRIASDYLPASAVRLVRATMRWLPSAVIANSQATMATLGTSRRSRRVIYSAVTAFREPGDVQPRTRPGMRVGIVGRLDVWKGQRVFLEAFERAFPDGAEEAVIIGAALFGGGAYERELRALADRPSLDGRVRFTGFVHDVASELADLDVLVHASVIPEPFGRVIAEGMAMGVAVVAAATGGPLELIEHDVNGLLYPAGDAGALAEAMRRLAGDDELRARLVTSGRQRAERFRPERVAAQIDSLYREVCRSG